MKVCKYGGRGVDIALKSFTSPGKDTVYWSPQRFHPNGDPAGGCNSFVLVASPERGQWKTQDGERVDLVSINGIGEVRWTVDSRSIHYGEDAHLHFNIIPWSEQTCYVVERDGCFRTQGGQLLWFAHKWEAEKASKTFGWPDGVVQDLTVAQMVELKTRIDRGEV